MEITSIRQVDLLYALFLGRMPENNFVRQDNLGRPVLDLVRAMIVSQEFRQSILDRVLLHGLLPHKALSLQVLPDVLELIADTGLARPNEGPANADWKEVLGRVLSEAPTLGIVEERYGEEGRQLIKRLYPALPPSPCAPVLLSLAQHQAREIVSGAEVVANTLCRGWIVDRNNLSAPLHVKIQLNGTVAKVLPANEFRRDVQDLYGGNGCVGFTVRLDLLPDARYLSRATIEITELSCGAVILPEIVIELSPAPAMRIEAALSEELERLKRCLDEFRSKFPGEHAQRKLPAPLRGLRARVRDANLFELQEQLEKLSASLEKLERELPELRTKNRWAISYYGVVRSMVDLVVNPPAAATPATFSIVIIDDAKEPERVATTLVSVLAQTLKPNSVAVIAQPSAPLENLPTGASIEIVHLQSNQSLMDAANSVVARVAGSHVLIFDAGVVLTPQALAWFAAAIDQTDGLIIYADGEIRVRHKSGREYLKPLFRSAFDYDLLLQRNYMGDIFCVKRQVYLELTGFGDETILDTRHDFLLRATARFGREAFLHLPLLLASHEAGASTSDTALARERTLRAVQSHLDYLGTGAQAIAHRDPLGRDVPDAVKILWRRPPEILISVIIPTRDRADMVFALISSLRRHASAWEYVEIVVVVNGELEPPARLAFGEIDKLFDRVRVDYRRVAFNWGEINNMATSESAGEIIIFLNDDIVCLTDGWDDRLRGQLARPEIGVVGGRLLYPNGMIQHAGITFRGDGATAHEAMGDLPSDGLYLDRTLLVHEVGAVTGAFLACRRDLFDALGGFDAQRYQITSSDADFCVRARAAGKSVIYDPFLTWIHHESVSRGSDSHDYKKHWRAEAEHGLWRAKFSELDLVDLSFDPHLTGAGRPFETFHRPSQNEIELWLRAQR